MESKLKSLKIIPVILFLIFSIFIISCSREKIKSENNTDNNSAHENPFLSEKFRKVGWINNSRYRAVVHIQTYDQCMKNSAQYVKEYLQMRALRTIQNELNTGQSRDAVIQINNLIKNNGIILRPDLQCKEINIYYFDIVKDSLQKDFQNIKTLR